MSRDDNRFRALSNIRDCVKHDRSLPERVFAERFEWCFFFESDCIFGPWFVETLRSFNAAEPFESVCLQNLSAFRRRNEISTTTMFIDLHESEDQYYRNSKEKGYDESDGATLYGWWADIATFACAPESGCWIMYCERNNDVAVVGFDSVESVLRHTNALIAIPSKSIEEINKAPTEFVRPFGDLVESWQTGLTTNYANPLHAYLATIGL